MEEPWKGSLDVVDELVANDYIRHDPANPEPLRGPEGVKKFISTYREAFPDARIAVEQQLAEGNSAATRWTGRGTHEGELMGIEPTGKQVTVSGLTISRLENGKIVEEYQNWDTFGMMEQLGSESHTGPRLEGAGLHDGGPPAGGPPSFAPARRRPPAPVAQGAPRTTNDTAM